jgi:pyrroline-5-carboxylate reductase
MSIKISFIGGGNMGEAILAALIKKGLSKPEDITVSDAKPERLEYLKTTYGISTTHSNTQAAERSEVLLLAVKPQNLNEVMAELAGKLKATQLVLSIIAGKKMEPLSQGLRHNAIVRAMPNTPAQIGKGITVWTAMPEAVKPAQREMARAIISVMGQSVYVGYEIYLDMATAVSGSGPAYVFLFMEALTEAARAIGLPDDMAKMLVLETVLGSAEYAHKANKDLLELRHMVTSPGGTTAEAIKVFEQGDFTEKVKSAVAAAYRRAQELGS